MNIATAYVDLRIDGTKAKADAKSAATGAAGVAKQALSLFSAALFVGGINKAIGAASRLEQAVGGTSAVFGEAATKIDAFAATSAKGFGISAAAARELTSQIGGLLKGFGFTQDAAAETSISLAQLGSDLAATFGGAPEEAVQALGAALRGETDPLERFGVSLNQAQINLKAVELGLAETTAKVDPNAKAQAALALIYERTADAQGQSAREADTAAGAQVRAAAAAEDAAAKFGQQLLPVYAAAQRVIGALATGFGALPGPIQLGVVALLGFVALAGPIKGVIDIAKTMGPVFSRMSSIGVASFGVLGAAVAAYAIIQFSANQSAKRGAQFLEDLAEASDAQVIHLVKLQAAIGVLDFEGIAKASLGAAIRIRDLALANDEFSAALSKSGLSQSDMANIIAAETQAQVRATEVTEAGTVAVDALGAATEGLGEATVVLTDEQKAALAATQEIIEAQRDSAQAHEDARTAVEALYEAQRAIAAGTYEYEAAVDAADDALRTYNETQWTEKVTLEEVDDAARTAFASQLALSEAYATAGGAALNSKEGTLRQVDALNLMIGQLGPGDPLRARLAQYRDELNQIPPQIDTLLRLRISQGQSATDTSGDIGRVGVGAMGAIVTRPTLALIGEAGPEGVFPLNRMPGASPLPTDPGGSSGPSLTINGGLHVGDRRDLPDTRATLDRVLWESRFR